MDPYVFDRSSVVRPGEPHFPRGLLDLSSVPGQVWFRGRLPAANARSIAVVGSRAATGAGAARIFELATDLAAAGWTLISGGALGIDAAAHRGALHGNGATVAVLGCGTDVIYPDRHARLFAEILAGGGGLLSEYAPGTPPRKQQFPARNRLVAALAEVVIVGECRTGSGALITARQAGKLGRRLLAIPGSAGTDALLAMGTATAVESAGDVIDVLAGKSAAAAPLLLPGRLEGLLCALGAESLSADVVARRSGASLAATLAALSEAELCGVVVRAPGARFSARFKKESRAGAGDPCPRDPEGGKVQEPLAGFRER